MKELKIEIYADGADIEQMKTVYKSGKIKGFTTNPSLMKKAGIKDYKKFAEEVVREFPDVPISFEVFGDNLTVMKREAEVLSSIGNNVFVKIPVTNSKGETTTPLIKELSAKGISLNITALFTVEQVKKVVQSLEPGTKNIISVFAGRIADTGVDPKDIMEESRRICNTKPSSLLLWASPREVLNIIQADEVGADIITCTPELISKMDNIGKDLELFSLETVQMFLTDSNHLGFSIIN